MTTAAPRTYFWGRYATLALAIAAAIVAVDQLNKWWLLDVFDIANKGRVAVLPFLDLVFVKNIGISYSLFNQESMTGQYLLTAFAVLASALMWIWINRPGTSRLAAISLATIIGGAIGNAIDRIRIGGVADFYSLHAYGFYWYVFNIADVAIVAGVAALLYESLKGESQ